MVTFAVLSVSPSTWQFDVYFAFLPLAGLSFCSAKRAALDLLPGAPVPSNGAEGSGRSTNETNPCDGTGEQDQNIFIHDRDQKLLSSLAPSSSVPACAAGVQKPAECTEAGAGRQEKDHDLSKRMLANAIAAAFGALATAVIESPVEFFRHQAQVS